MRLSKFMPWAAAGASVGPKQRATSGGEGLLNFGDVYEDEKVLILHGRRGLQTWTAVVDKNTGAHSGSVSQIGRSFTQFGTCTGITP